ncbi:hypothetical protein ABL78_8181 [Leptomonas seymouri]|uniref:Uncharacterized protein n=1 Tax=Leptomonas seymouri TaxID=5684 RepID=A0A0N1HYI3_LEPSE|nr:hypothetical protein ABL78_8181 [Leptomonas seymouri]|eukprot:KPI82805.1 hypothetical protein ABL78_8181 [Leptomonas seymouri]
MQSAHDSSSKLERTQGGGASRWAGSSIFNNSGSGFLPSASDGLLRTSAADNRGSAATTGVATGSASAKTVAVPVGGLRLSGGPGLVERSAFLYGLLHSERLVYDVRDAIAAVTAAVADTVEDDDSSAPERRRAHGRINGGAVLSGVFYFPSQVLRRDMPWRPTYKSAVLLCVFVSAAACQRAIARLNVATTSVRCGTGAQAAQAPAHSSVLAPSGVPSSFITLRPANEYTLSPGNVDTALLTFLTAPQLADLLLRRRRMQVPLERGSTDHVGGRGDIDRAEDMLAYVRANPPSSRLSSSAARLYAAILSPQSTYNVNWAAAQVAVNRGDGVVVPEMEVVEPWVGGGHGLEDRNHVLREQDRRGGSEAAGPGRGGGGSDGGRHPDTRTGSSNDSLPLTLQEEDYRKRYGLTAQGHLSGGGGDRRDSSDGLSGLMPSRSSLYLGARQVFRGASWFFRRLRDGLAEEEAPLLTSSNGPSGSTGGIAAMPIPLPLSRHASHSTNLPLVGAATPQSERGQDEPPRQRHRAEDGGEDSTRERQRSSALVIPRYNAIGTALSWMPGFQRFGRLFVTSTTVLTPEGAAPRVEGAHRSHRRRPREEAADDYENPVWESLVMQRYADAAAGRMRTSQGPQTAAPVHDSVLSWMSPARGTGWPAPPSWPSEEVLHTREAVDAPTEGRAAALAWASARTAEPSFPGAPARTSVSRLDSLAVSTVATHLSPVGQTEGEVLQLPGAASAVRSSFDGAQGPAHALSRANASRSHHLIKVEGVHATAPLLSSADDGSSFLSHHRRRLGRAKAQRKGLAAEEASSVPSSDAAQRTASAHSSLAEGLRKSTGDARENESGASAPHTPLGAGQRIGGAVGTRAKPAAAAAEVSARSSRRTVSFALPG